MKCYLPTSTLNFDSILSSQIVWPPAMYTNNTLWWNHYEYIVGERPDVLVLYAKCPVWEICDHDRDNYPLVIEVNQTFSKSEVIEINGLKAVVLQRPLFFSQLDLAKGKIRFLFRNEKERDRIVGKTLVGVSECKVASVLELDYPKAFDIVPIRKCKQCDLGTVQAEIGVKIASLMVECVRYSVDDYRKERDRGAELGYQVGRFIKSVQSGRMFDAFRSPLSFRDWRNHILPEPFALILERFCCWTDEQWNPNRSALVAMCKRLWYDCFEGRKYEGAIIKSGTPIHTSLQRIAQHWASPEIAYKVSDEKNMYMQAFAAFLECGTVAHKYHRYLDDVGVRCPEYMFALYGALVGYTFFSRALLDLRQIAGNNISLVSNVLLPIEQNGACKMARSSVNCEEGQSGTMTNREEGSGSTRSVGSVLQESCASREKRQMDLFKDVEVYTKATPVKLPFVDDPALIGAVRAEFVDFSPDRIDELVRVVMSFVKKYSPGEYYACHPEKYKRINSDLIQHLLSCMASQKEMLRDLKFIWNSTDERHRFERFLTRRYATIGQ